MGLWEYTQQGKGGEWSEWTELRPCSCNYNNSKSLRLFVDQKLRISFSLIINFAYLWNFGVSPRYALAGVLQLPINLVAACRISARLPAPSSCLCHSGSWPLSDTRNQNTERRRGWIWGRGRGRRRRRLVALARSFQGDSLTQPRVSLNTLFEREHKPYAHVIIYLKISVVSRSRVPRTIAVIPTGCLLACHKI